jgi:hypothetical protein
MEGRKEGRKQGKKEVCFKGISPTFSVQVYHLPEDCTLVLKHVGDRPLIFIYN